MESNEYGIGDYELFAEVTRVALSPQPFISVNTPIGERNIDAAMENELRPRSSLSIQTEIFVRFHSDNQLQAMTRNQIMIHEPMLCTANHCEPFLPERQRFTLATVGKVLRRLASAKLIPDGREFASWNTELIRKAVQRLLDSRGNANSHAQSARFIGALSRRIHRMRVEHFRDNLQLRSLDEKRSKSPRSGRAKQTVDFDLIRRVESAIDGLAVDNRVAADVIRLRVFSGMALSQIADTMDLSIASVYRHWGFARAYVRTCLHTDTSSIKNRRMVGS